MIHAFDHTGDVGFEVQAASLSALFSEAMRGLIDLMFSAPPSSASDKEAIQLEAADLEGLLVSWLNELIFLIQTLGFVPVKTDLTVTQGESGWRLAAHLIGAPLELEAYGWQGEIKGATFHGLEVAHRDHAWQARVVLDV